MRLERPLHAQRRTLLLLLLIGSSMIIVGTNSAGSATSAPILPSGLGAVSAPESPALTLSTHDQGVLRRFNQTGLSLTDVDILTTRFGRQYYRVDNTSGSACFGLGTAGAKDVIGALGCASDFPSPTQPVLDFTGFRQTRGDPSSARITRSEGFAADGIAEIVFRTVNGQLVSATPVINNVYVVPNPPDERIVALIARDKNGATVWTQDYPAVQ